MAKNASEKLGLDVHGGNGTVTESALRRGQYNNITGLASAVMN